MAPETPLLLESKHDRELARTTHPPDWNNPAPAPRYDLIVLGGGTAGLVSAGAAGLLGARVALVERDFLGGDCLVTGCVPSKALLRCARAAGELRSAARFGLSDLKTPEINFPAVMERMRSIRARISQHDAAARLRDEFGVDVFFGTAHFTAPASLRANGVELKFARAIIATGARATVAAIPGLKEAGFFTNETIFNLTARPARLAVLGGGPLGCEMAQAFARLGSEVTIIDRGKQFLHREDPDAADVLRRQFERDGIDIHLGTTVERIEIHDGAKRLHLRYNDREQILAADAILVGVGRTPNVDELHLEAAGIEYNQQGVKVDDYLLTSNHRIFAAGDVCLKQKFTHMADASARLAVQNALRFP